MWSDHLKTEQKVSEKSNVSIPVFSIQIKTPFNCFLYPGVQYSDPHSTVFQFYYYNFTDKLNFSIKNYGEDLNSNNFSPRKVGYTGK